MQGRRVGVLFEGWEPCLRPRFAVELGLPEKSTPTRLPGFAGLGKILFIRIVRKRIL
jgi:hypothetical protein